MNNTPLPSGIVDRIEEFLIEFEDRLIAQGVDPDAARSRTDKAETLIRNKVDTDPACRASLSRFEEFLESLATIPEAKPSGEFVSFPAGPRIPSEPRIPKVVKFAFAWGLCPLLMAALLWIPEDVLETENPGVLQTLLVNLIVTLAVTAPVGATALALVGLRQIRFGRGFFLGETFAVGIVLFYPTLIAGAGVWFGVRALLAERLEGGALGLAALLLSLLTVFLTIQIGMKSIRSWFDRMEGSGRYWTAVGEIPPSRRPPGRPPEIR